MSGHSFWKGDGKSALLGKAVVSPTGHVVARNYDPKTLHEGDLGIGVRVDRKFEEMTPEQRMAAGGVADELANLLRGAVGAETELGFAPGMVVRATDGNSETLGLIERITPHSVLLRVVNNDGKLVLKQLPLNIFALEEAPEVVGIPGLVLIFLEGSAWVRDELIERVRPEDLLTLAMRSSSREVKIAAIMRFVDPAHTIAMLKETQDQYVRDMCLKKITDPDALVQLVLSNELWNGERGRHPLTIFKRLCDLDPPESYFKLLAKQALHYLVREGAVRQITDRAFLDELLYGDDSTAASAAYEEIRDEIRDPDLDPMDVVRRLSPKCNSLRSSLLNELTEPQMMELVREGCLKEYEVRLVLEERQARQSV